MPRWTRRHVLLGLSLGAGLAAAPVGAASSRDRASTSSTLQGVSELSLEKRGQSLLGAAGVEYAEGVVRDDGAYAAIGTWNNKQYGSFLIDLSTPSNPRRSHFLRSPDRVMNMDVKFGGRDGLYYRSQQPIGDQEMSGVEIVDYGFEDGAPEDPAVIGRLDAGSTHNLFPHPTEPIVYAVNHDSDPDTLGVEIWDVGAPSSPTKVDEVGRKWSLHDVTYNRDSELLHCAYGKGYVVMDASDPTRPTELGALEYADRPSYEDVGLGNEGFEAGHYALEDPRRDLVVMGDEVSTGVPGGKHIIDIGWDEGSPENPVPIGFTTSPNAEIQELEGDRSRSEIILDWTGHNFDVVPWGDATLLVSGDWHEGVVLYDITDPRDPTPIDRYATDDRADEVPGRSRWGAPPMAWSAVYNAERDVVVVSDDITGVYTFRIDGGRPRATDTPTPDRTPGDERPHTPDGGDGDWWWFDWDFGVDWEFDFDWLPTL